MAMWQRGGNFLHQRLSKLYSDTKQSYEEAKVVPTESTNIEDNPDVTALRKDFIIQQDRLLAWGMHWADVGVHTASSYIKGQPVNIDKKIDQAGLGDVVASVMEEIKRLLDESGKLQHPERYEMGKKLSSPRLQRKEWKDYEVKTGRVLLDQLTSCIDVLYSLIENQKQEQKTSPRSKSMSVDEAFGTTNDDTAAVRIFSHPLYIDFASLAPMHDPDASAEPPSYDDAQDSSGIKARSIYYYPIAQAHVVVDLVSIRSIPVDQDPKSPLQQLHQLSDKLSGGGLLSWDGHLKLLGFTLAAASSRFGLVYALPAPKDQTALQKYQTLGTTIASSCEHDTSIPPLENKFRLAYNIALLTTGYLAHNSTHGYINSLNIMFLRESENSQRLGRAVRCPYLLQPIKKIVGVPVTGETALESIYHHPDADEAGYGALAAYDIYSVGLVLLELGLWIPIKKFWKAKYDRALFAERLRRTYSPKLASKCGSRYMKAVQRCLDAPEELADKSSAIDAAVYLLEIVKDLALCCALDEDEQPSSLDVEILEALIDEQNAIMPPQSMQIKRKPVASTSVPVSAPPLDKDIVNKEPGSKPRLHRKYTPGSGHTSLENAALKKYPEMPIPQQHLTEWNTCLMPKLSKILNHALKGSNESASVSLMMLGKTPEQAKTTICIQCTNTTGVRDTICKRFKPARGWGVVILKGDIRRSGRYRGSNRRSRNPRRSAGSADGEDEDTRTLQQEYQKRPGPGASIGAYKDGEHLPPVSFGGTILVDGEMYGMTVHHMLDDPSDDSDSDPEDDNLEDQELEEQLVDNIRRSMAPRDHDATWHRGLHEASKSLGFDESSFSPEALADEDEFQLGEEYESDSDTDTIRPDYSLFDEDGTEHWFLDDGDTPGLDDDFGSDDEDDAVSIGDIPGIMPFTVDDDELCITQPAIDDVDEDFFPSFEDRDDDHLASHAFGHIHASSGIKRVFAGGLKHEVDWALIRVNEERRIRRSARSKASSRGQPPTSRSSTSSNARSGPITEPHLTSISPVETLPNTKVTCIARTSGPSTGRISPALSLVKLRGRMTASASFTVQGGFGLPGDSGAWIWSEERNELCGHVLAYSQVLRQAYMAPMQVMVDDIKKTLAAEKVELPAQAALGLAAVTQQRKGKAVLEVVEGHIEGREQEAINRDLARARELEVALAGLRLEQPLSHNATDGTVSGQDVSSSQPQTNPSPQPIIHCIDINVPNANSANSSASSSYASPVSRHPAGSNIGSVSGRSETSRTRKERFDIPLRSGGKELQSLPMARALS